MGKFKETHTFTWTILQQNSFRELHSNLFLWIIPHLQQLSIHMKRDEIMLNTTQLL